MNQLIILKHIPPPQHLKILTSLNVMVYVSWYFGISFLCCISQDRLGNAAIMINLNS